MRIAIVYASKHGNTRRLASAMTEALIAHDHDVRLVPASSPTLPAAVQTELLFVGAPTQVHGLVLGVRGFLTWLKRSRFDGVPAAAFDTRLPGDIRRTGSAATIITRGLEQAGCAVVAQPESFLVEGREGPLADGEEARAVAWAVGLARALSARPAAA